MTSARAVSATLAKPSAEPGGKSRVATTGSKVGALDGLAPAHVNADVTMLFGVHAVSTADRCPHRLVASVGRLGLALIAFTTATLAAYDQHRQGEAPA